MARRWKSIQDVIAANRQIGHHWFDGSTMRFFESTIETGILRGCYFITSETGPSRQTLYSIRVVRNNGAIGTIGNFNSHETVDDAKEALRQHLLELESTEG